MDQPTLTKLLKAEGIAMSATELHTLAQGAAAAPPGLNPDRWMNLVTPAPTLRLKTVLRDLMQGITSASTSSESAVSRLIALRKALVDANIDGFIVPRADEHQGEYVPSCAQRLSWLTGFTGSAGTVAVLDDRAALFVDGRYTLQAEMEVDQELYQVVSIADTSMDDWLADELPDGSRLGYDPRLHSRNQAQRLRKTCESAGSSLIAVDRNPLDSVWTTQPPPPISPVAAHDERFAGQGLREKCIQIASRISESGSEATVLTMTDSIAWLLNLRGGDVEFTPLAMAFAILHRDSSVDLFIDARKLGPDLGSHLGSQVAIHAPEHFGAALNRLKDETKQIQIDPATANDWICRQLAEGKAKLIEATDPCALPKAIKNSAELDGTRAAHLRDGVALTRFLHWINNASENGQVTEIDAADQLETFRRQGKNFQGLSFPTISGAGNHGAIVHYRVDAASNRPLLPGELYLVDSGAQYLDGTTDVTRTIAVGTPSEEMRDRFTRVLKGHIAIATALFPVGTVGGQLDTLARQSLWNAGLDYEHGTGHGVGSFLNVHEGPHRISKSLAGAPLKPGMIVSNEPGYYKTDAYGIRIENLVTVVERGRPESGERDLLGFDTLTWAPIDRCLVQKSLLNDKESNWLNRYHTKVRETLTPLLDNDAAAWLKSVTASI